MGSYFTDRFNRSKLRSVVREWQRVTRGCPQGSAFGPLIWKIMQMTTSFTPLAAPSLMCISSRYRANFLKENLDKYQTMVPGNRKESMNSILIDNHEVRPTECLKLLGACIDNNLGFDEHISSISRKSSQRVGVLMRLRNLIPTQTKNCLRSNSNALSSLGCNCDKDVGVWRENNGLLIDKTKLNKT